MADEKQQLDWDKIKNFSKQVSNDIGAAMLGALSYIGDRLGIFSALAQAGAVTSAQLAEKTGLSERYLREWLGAMTAAGYVNYDAAAKTYAMPAEHAMVLARDDSPFFAGGFIEMIVPQMSIAPKVLDSFKDGARRFAERISAGDVGGDGAFVGLDVPASAGAQMAADDATSCRETDRGRQRRSTLAVGAAARRSRSLPRFQRPRFSASTRMPDRSNERARTRRRPGSAIESSSKSSIARSCRRRNSISSRLSTSCTTRSIPTRC